jgi:hypothetical protein
MTKAMQRTIKICLTATAVFTVALAWFTGCEDPGSYADIEPVVFNRLLVHGSSTAPPMDNPRDQIWGNALTCLVYASDSAFVDPAFVTDSVDSSPVLIKSISSGGYLYLRIEWLETGQGKPTYSVWEKPAFHFLNVNITDDTIFDTTLDLWSRRSLKVDTGYISDVPSYYDTTFWRQDRFAVIWDSEENGDEGADCRSMCHDPGNESMNGHRMYTTGGGYADVWQWQAGTADPVHLAQDEYWDVNGRNLDAFTQGITSDNFDTTAQLPINMHQYARNYRSPFLHARDTLPFDETLEWKHGDLISSYVLNDNADGSLADVDCFSSFNVTWGRWMILMRRQLNTGYPDDVDLSTKGAGDSLMISVAYMDRSDSTHHGSRPFYIFFP